MSMSKFQFEERPYQREAVAKVLDFFKSGRESILLESPVGSGKTIMGLLAVKALQEQSNGKLRVNWVASRKHILRQAQEINEAFFRCKLNTVSVFSSNFPQADLVVLDEAHHEATQSCLNMYECCGNTLTLGLSATPLRTDRMKLSFQATVRCSSIQELIHMGVLSQYHSYVMPEWSVKLAAEIFCAEPEKWGKTLAFFHTIQECRTFQKILERHGVFCDIVTGKSDKDAQLQAFINGDIQVVANVSVLSEGFDLPELQTVFLRDASRLPTIQMAGRGLRRSPFKQHCNIVQSAESPFLVEKIAEAKESFRYIKGKWRSCSGNTKIIIETFENSIKLLEKKKENTMPFFFSLGKHVRQVRFSTTDRILLTGRRHK